jgi:hypothetical protein
LYSFAYGALQPIARWFQVNQKYMGHMRKRDKAKTPHTNNTHNMEKQRRKHHTTKQKHHQCNQTALASRDHA